MRRVAAGLIHEAYAIGERSSRKIDDDGPARIAGVPERSWPHRFEVIVHTHAGTARTYSAVTWRSPQKAVALTVIAHHERYDLENTAMRIHDLEVADLGPVDRAPDGTTALEPGDVLDRLEF